MAITKDGEFAYLSFCLSEDIFKVSLKDLAVVSVADLSEYFPIGFDLVALSASEEKLFVYTPTWRKLIVLDTQTMSVIHTIDDIGISDMIQSQYSPTLITWGGGNTVKFINTETYEVTEFVDSDEFFMKILESNSNQDLWVVVSGKGHGASEVNAGIYDHKTNTWSRKISLPPLGTDTIHDLVVLPNEQKAYVAIYGGWNPDHGAHDGWLDSIDLLSGEVKAIPIDGGVFCLEASPDSQRLYVAAEPSSTSTNNLLVVDTQSNEIVDQIYLGQTQYGWYYTQMNRLQIDPQNASILYGTNSDANALIKVDLDSLTLSDVHVFNQESFGPHIFVRQPGQATGFVLIQSPYAFELDLDQATIKAVVRFPNIQDAGGYDIAINNSGRMLIAQGETILEVDPKDMRLLIEHPLPKTVSGFWSFVLSNDQTSLFSIWPDPSLGGWPPNTFLRINTSSFQVEAKVKLEGVGFNSRPFELPNGSKLYALGGQQNGPVVIQVIDTATSTIQKTITFEEPGMPGISAGPYYPFAYEPNSHTLFVCATEVVLAIDTDIDVIKKVIHLGDVARAIGLEPFQFIYGTAIGMVYNPQENFLYIAHLDRSFISIYDLGNDKFLSQIIPLKGYFPDFIFANDDYSKIYTLNVRSDSVSVIDVTTKAVVNVIDLHSYLAEP